tara:strand:- start:90 stop:518 length:429 start_codon:yes stop_codon:yes gene_type:complete
MQSSGIILCDDILGLVGKEVEEIREGDTRDYYIDLWNTSERHRGWWCLADTEMIRLNPPSAREKTLNAVEQIGTQNFFVSDDGVELSLGNKIDSVNIFGPSINGYWIDYNHYMEHDYMVRFNNDQPSAIVSLDDDGEVLFVY